MKSIPAPEICRVLLNQRYLAPGETTHDDVFRRVAHALAAPERVDQRARCTRRIYANLIRGAIGAGRIMANAGTRKDATMVNCFVHPIVAPGVRVASPESVSLALTQACRTLRMGGGVGYDFSALAPGCDDLFIVNPFGQAFRKLTASKLPSCDFQDPVKGKAAGPAPGGFSNERSGGASLSARRRAAASC